MTHDPGSGTPDLRPGPGRLATAALAGGSAYLVEMWLDELLFRDRTDDLVLLGGLGSRSGLWSRVLGLLVHFANSGLVVIAYAYVARPRLPGPGWARGLAAFTAENTLLWPIVIALDGVHPWVRDGRLPRYNRGVPWLQSVLRHVAFGLVVGRLLGPVDSPTPIRDRTTDVSSSHSADPASGS